MAKADEINKQALWWTTIIVTITSTLIDKLFDVINRGVNSDAFASAPGYFSSSQPDYFPLIYMIVVFFATLITVWLYAILQSRMPKNWIIKGIIVGIILFIVADLANMVETGYATAIPGAAARGKTFLGLLASLVNGCILTYIYSWVSGERKKSK
ncbi:MAG: hypothetical protein JSW64_02580 [Candidatus Zixiibacteriota bacterium]|nr:MAG: hypothetical protein JSW64_02580 [candidate division Zixibacteria bacterium]